MGDAAKTPTYADYLTLTPPEGVRYEYDAGLVVELHRGTLRHGVLVQQLGVALNRLLGAGPCEAVQSGLRVRSEALDKAVYPDVVVVCGPYATASDDPDAVTNPVLLDRVALEQVGEHRCAARLTHWSSEVARRPARRPRRRRGGPAEPPLSAGRRRHAPVPLGASKPGIRQS